MVSFLDAPGLSRMLQHASAEINTAIREGFYVQMGCPTIQPVQDESGEIVDMKFCLNYEIQPREDKRTKHIDLRDELSKQRNPDYEPPRGG